MKYWEILKRGLLVENPIFVIILGLCPALAVTTAAVNSLGIGLATTFVLICSNLLVSLARKLISDKTRIPCYIVIIATFVTIADYFMAAYFLSLHKSLGIYIPLIVANCLVLGRAEVFAAKNKVSLAVADGLGMGLGFTGGLTLIAVIRELLGTGKIFGFAIMNPEYQGPIMAILPPGAFLTIGLLLGIFNAIGHHREQASIEKAMVYQERNAKLRISGGEE